jgi:hypothetical protein
MPRPLVLGVALIFALTAALGARTWLAGRSARVLQDRSGWTTLPSGLELGVFPVVSHPEIGDGRLAVVRIDPARFALKLRTASADPRHRSRTAADWMADDPTVLGAINASMFDVDGSTAVSLLVADGQVNNGTLSKDNAVLAFGPDSPDLPAARIIDRTCEDLDALRPHYQSLVQGIRMVGCNGENTWAEQPRAWSEAAIGQDDHGRILFLFSRTPFTAHAFVDHVLGLGIGVTRMQHGDGGPPAEMAWRNGAAVEELVGSYESDVAEHDQNTTAQDLPNLLGVVAR